MRQYKRKRKVWPVVLTVVLVIVIAVGVIGAVVWNKQKSNIEALRYAGSYSKDEIAQKIEDHDAETQEIVSQFAGQQMRPLTAEESEMLQNGEITEEQAVALITGAAETVEDLADSTEAEEPAEEPHEEASGQGNAEAEPLTQHGSSETSTGSGSNASSSSAQGGNSSAGSSSNVSNLLAKVYVLKSEYTSSIDSLISQGLAEVNSLPAAERTTAKKMELMTKYAELGSSLESSCDAKMNSLLSEIEAEINRTGGDRSVVDTIRSSYEEEKKLKKAELLSKYS